MLADSEVSNSAGEDLEAYSASEIRELLKYATPEEREELVAEMDEFLKLEAPIWVPQPGPQVYAYESEADVLGFGGQAGSGKSGILAGLTVTKHQKSLLIRREATQLSDLRDNIVRIVGHRNGLNEQRGVWRDPVPGKTIEFGSIPNPGDEKKYQGRAHDLLGFDEATECREYQVRFMMGWVRSIVPGQRCRTVLTFNPPDDVAGLWVVRYFAPWIDDSYQGNRALPGELRYFATLGDEDVEVEDGRKFVEVDGDITYDFDPMEYEPERIVTPASRTFIPSKLSDNIFLGDAYLRQLQALTPELRERMLHGKFTSFIRDDPMQVCPTEWVDAAMARWTDAPGPKPPMSAVGVDIARGGKDFTEIAYRHGWWFGKPVSHKGVDTPDGASSAAYVLHVRKDDCPVFIDAIGVGTSPTDKLVEWGVYTIPVIANRATLERDRSQLLTFSNVRTQMWWRFRELLDPSNGYNIALPRDDRLKADLTAMTYVKRGVKLCCLSREELIKKIGRSPDRGTAFVQAAMEASPRKKKDADNDFYIEKETMWQLA
jgi:hypothetical protein